MSVGDHFFGTPSLINADASVGIIVALLEELATLTDTRLKPGECSQIGNTWIVYSGAGFDNAAAAAQMLIEKNVHLLISWGCAAGLSAAAKPGDLVIATQVVDAQKSFDTDNANSTALRQAFASNLTVHDGTLYSSADLISLSQDKQRIHQLSQAVALDMESAAIAKKAQHAQLPFLVIRSIVDPVSMDLPNAVTCALNSHGQISLPKLIGYLCWHPWEITALIRLGRHFKAAQNTLKIVARELQTQQKHPS